MDGTRHNWIITKINEIEICQKISSNPIHEWQMRMGYIGPQISKGAKIDCLSLVYVPATCAAHNSLLFFFLLRPFTVLMKKTRTIKQSIFLDVYVQVVNENLMVPKFKKTPISFQRMAWAQAKNESRSCLGDIEKCNSLQCLSNNYNRAKFYLQSPRGMYHKTFYSRNLRIFIKS